MMKMKSESKIIIVGVLILLISSFFSVAFAEIKEVEIRIDGLSCPFCVFGLKQQMKKLEAIDRLNISLKNSLARITLKEGSSLNIEDLKNAVKDAGFSVREIRISAGGEIVTYGNFFALKVTGTDQLFILNDAKKLKVDSKVLIKGRIPISEDSQPYRVFIESMELSEE